MLEYTDDMQYEKIPRKAILVGVRLPGSRRFDERMRELEGLAEACGIEPVGFYTQALPRIDAAHYIGSGKVQEIKNGADTLHANLIIINNTLTPSQLATLSTALECEVIDRTNLILTIFAERAASNEAKLQVDYAKLKYALPRLVGLRSNLSRQGGSAGSLSNRGAGEKKIELDRRKIEKRMALLRSKLNELEKDRLTQRKHRERTGIPLVSLVGYTNAGKSTLMNRMLRTFCPAEDKLVEEKDMLFATLDTAVRRIEPAEVRPFLLADTVGFIDDLPTSLIEAFHSTLEEALAADLILHVVDCSDEEYEAQIEVTEQTLSRLGAGEIPRIVVMNKADLLAEPPSLPAIRQDQIWLSAKHGVGLHELIELIDRKLHADSITATFLFPYAEGHRENALRGVSEILSCTYREDGIAVTARLDHAHFAPFASYRID